MKIRKYIVLLLFLLPLFSLVGCKNDNKNSGNVKITYYLEGGLYKNSSRPIYHYYDFEPGTSNLIIDINDTDIDEEVTKSGFILEGWYQTKHEDNGSVTYSDKWDFESDKVSDEGLTLYACWKKEIIYTYNLCYVDENNEEKSLGIYQVQPGDVFKDYLNYMTLSQNKPIGYTGIGLYDSDGNPWDNSFTHPGGEENLEIKVYVKYIKGSFAVVKSSKELILNKNKNIYLAADIDMEGQAFNFNNYKGIFMGNEYTISNFTINYDAKLTGLTTDFDEPTKSSLCISIFGNIKEATIENVNFDNITVNIKTGLTKTHKIYVAPIAVSAVDSTISNVTFNGVFNYSINDLPKDFNVAENLILVTNYAVWKDENSDINATVEIIVNNKTK